LSLSGEKGKNKSAKMTTKGMSNGPLARFLREGFPAPGTLARIGLGGLGFFCREFSQSSVSRMRSGSLTEDLIAHPDRTFQPRSVSI